MATEVKGLMVEIGADTTKMNKAINQLKAPLKSLKNELKYVDKALKFNPKNTDLLAQKMRLLEKSVEEAEGNAKQLRAELQRLKEAKAPDEQIRRLERELAFADREAKQLKRDLISFKASQSTLGRVGAQMQTLGNRMTKLGNSMRSVSIYAGMATAAIGAMGIKAAQHADDINTLSSKTGVLTDTLQKFGAASELVDVSTENMAKAQGKVVKAMKDSPEVFEKYGISVKNADGSMRDSESVFFDYMNAMEGITNKTERASAMQEVFGQRAYQSLMPLVGNVDKLEEYSKRFEELGLIMDQDTLDKLNDINDKIDYMKAVGSLAFFKIGGAIAEALAPALEGLDEKVAKFADWVAGLNPIVVRIGAVIGALAVVFAPLMIVFGAIASGVGSLMGVFARLSPAIKLAIGPIGRFTPLLMGMLGPVGTAIAVIGALVGIFTVLQKSGVDVESAIGDFIAGLSEKISKVAEIAPTIITGFVNAIVNNLPMLIQSTITIMNAIIQGIVNNLPLLLNAGIKLILALIKGLTQAIPRIIAALPKIIKALVNGLIAMRGQILRAGIKLIIALVKGIIQAIPRVMAAIMNLARRIPRWILSGIKGLASVGAQIITGLWQGIGNKVGWLKSKISGFVGNVKSWLKKFFKIGSPSRLMADEIGKWIPEGIAVGIEGNMSGLRRAVSGMAQTIMPDMSVGSPVYQGGINYNRLADVMVDAFGSVTIQANSYLNGKKVSNAIAGDMNNAINTLHTRDARRLGFVGV